MINVLANAASQTTGADISNGLVVVMGIGIVFVGLISIIIICSIMGSICKALIKQPVAAAVEEEPEQIPNRQEMVAAVSAAIAEELGAEVSAIRIKSIRRV
ncbi:MAG: OadG family protein [Clostridia bacterium]|nr:OadG family protein [Clostridia bacterium]